MKLINLKILFSKTKEDIDVKNIGNHFVANIYDFHDDMIQYLYTNARRSNKKIKMKDAWIMTIEVDPKYIDYYETLNTFSLHPNEDEITLKNTTDFKIINIDKYFED